MAKDLHIVFGLQAKGVLIHSEIYDANKMELACLSDNLSIGPISHLETKTGKENRINSLINIYQEYPPNEIANMVQSDFDLTDNLKKVIGSYNQIYLWLGADVNEILCTARLLSLLEGSSFSDFNTINFLGTSLTNNIGKLVYPKSLNETNLNHVPELYRHFTLLTKQELKEMQLLWEKLSRETTDLRVATEISQISGSEIDFYDAVIMDQCTNRYIVAAKVIGKTLGIMSENNIRTGVGDSFINWRLKMLVEQKKLKFRGNRASMRDYEVRLM